MDPGHLELIPLRSSSSFVLFLVLFLFLCLLFCLNREILCTFSARRTRNGKRKRKRNRQFFLLSVVFRLPLRRHPYFKIREAPR
jgi:hypothetical protein